MLPPIRECAAPQYDAKTLRTEKSFIRRDNGLPLKLLDLLRTVFFILLPSYLFVCCGVDLNGFNQQLFKLLVFKVTNLSYIQTLLFFFSRTHII